MIKSIILTVLLLNIFGTCFAQSVSEEPFVLLHAKIYEIIEKESSEGKGLNLIASPRCIITTNNKTEIFMGDDIPIINRNPVEFKKVGINIVLLPIIKDDVIDLNIKTDISLVKEFSPNIKTKDYSKEVYFNGHVGEEFIFLINDKYQVNIFCEKGI